MGLVDNVLRFFFGDKPPRAVPPPHTLDAVCEQYKCRYDRAVYPTGEVQIRLLRDDATLTAVGPTTADAVKKIAAKAHACWGAL